MPNTYTQIASSEISVNTGTITFSSIPSTFTDLVLRFSGRGNFGNANITPTIRLNGNSSGVYRNVNQFANTTAVSNSATTAATSIPSMAVIPDDAATANTFSDTELYIANYTQTARFKTMSLFSVAENNSTANFDWVVYHGAQRFGVTDAITSITIAMGADQYVAGSTFYLYGIKNF
jgi:hypothetical protein